MSKSPLCSQERALQDYSKTLHIIRETSNTDQNNSVPVHRIMKHS